MNPGSDHTSRTSTATSFKNTQHNNGPTQVSVPSSYHFNTSSGTSLQTSTTKSSRQDLHRLTEANLLQHRQRYDDVAITFEEEARTRKLQEVGSRLGFDLPIHCYEKEKWKPHGWIEERELFRTIDVDLQYTATWCKQPHSRPSIGYVAQ